MMRFWLAVKITETLQSDLFLTSVVNPLLILFISLQILEVSCPSTEYVSDSEQGSDSDDLSLLSEDEPLIMAIQSAPNTNPECNLLTTPPITAQERHPRTDSPSSLGDFSEDVDIDLMNGTEMLRAMSSLEKTNDVSC